MRTFRGRPGASGLAPGGRLRFIGYSRSRHALAVLAGIALLLGVVAGGTVPAAAGTAAAQRGAGPVPRTMLAWGDNPFGQLGDGTTTSSSVPVAVNLPAGVTVTAVAAGSGHSLALTSAGQLLAWGDNAYGQLGDGTTISRSVPAPVDLPAGVTVTAIAAGAGHSLALTSAEQLFAWGWNVYGQLGDGTTVSRSVPAPVDLPAGVTVTAIAAGAGHSLALTSAGQLFAWGYNAYGQLGDGTTVSRSLPAPVDLPAGVTVTAIAAGAGHSLALTSAGQLLAWGNNRHGQLGDGTTISRSVPVAVDLPAGVTVTAIAAGDYYGLALTSAGQLLAWGYNAFGQLGDGTLISRSVPVAVDLPAGVTVIAVAAGSGLALALTSAGQLLAWGDNAFGQLGDGTTSSSSVPVAVDLPTATAATVIAAGYLHSLAIVRPLRIPPRAHPAVSIVKTASVGSFAVAGTPVTFTYTVTNTGNVPLYGVTVTDSRLGEVCGGPFTLAPGGTRPCTVEYVTSAADVAAGQIAGTVTVTGTAAATIPGGTRLTSQDSLIIPLLAEVLPQVPVTG